MYTLDSEEWKSAAIAYTEEVQAVRCVGPVTFVQNEGSEATVLPREPDEITYLVRSKTPEGSIYLRPYTAEEFHKTFRRMLTW